MTVNLPSVPTSKSKQSSQSLANIDVKSMGQVQSLIRVTEQVLKLGKQKEINTVFLTRALNAITHLVEHSSLVNASAAPSDYEVLLRVLESPES